MKLQIFWLFVVISKTTFSSRTLAVTPDNTTAFVCDMDVDTAVSILDITNASPIVEVPVGTTIKCRIVNRLNGVEVTPSSNSKFETSFIEVDGRLLTTFDKDASLEMEGGGLSMASTSRPEPAFTFYRAHAEYVVRMAGRGVELSTSHPMVFKTVPASRLYSWRLQSRTVNDNTGGRSLARDGNYQEPGIIDGSDSYKVASMSCSNERCYLATSFGRVYRWGGGGNAVANDFPIARKVIAVSTAAETSSFEATYALTREGDLITWNSTWQYAEMWFQGDSLVGAGNPKLQLLTSFGSFIMAAGGPRVLTWAAEPPVGFTLGRGSGSGDALKMPQQIALPGLSNTDNVTSICAGHSRQYGIIVVNGLRIFSFGNGLVNTTLPSGDTPMEYSGSVPWSGSQRIMEVSGNAHSVYFVLSDGKFASLNLTSNGRSPEYAFPGSTLASQHILGVSAGIETVLSYDDDGQAWFWMNEHGGSPALLTMPTVDQRLSVRYAYSAWVQFVDTTAPTFHVWTNDANRPRPGETCVTETLHCLSLPEVLNNAGGSRSVMAGTTIILHSDGGTHVLRTDDSDRDIYSEDVRILGEGGASRVNVQCAGMTCIRGRGKGLQVRGLSFSQCEEVYAPFYPFHARLENIAANGCTSSGVDARNVVALTISNSEFVDCNSCVKVDGTTMLYLNDTTFHRCRSSSSYGGAMALENTAASLKNVLIHTGTSDRGGGALWADGATITLEDVVVKNSHAHTDVGNVNGGGMFIQNSDVTSTNLSISDCTADGFGAGLYVEFTKLAMDGLVIHNNSIGSSSGSGAGLFVVGNRPNVITNAEFSANSAPGTGKGGGIYASYNRLHFTNVNINNNIACAGGGVYLATESSLYFSNVQIMNNEARSALASGTKPRDDDGVGGGILMHEMSKTSYYEKSVFESNTASFRGGAIAMYTSSRAEYQGTSSVFNSNSARAGGALWTKFNRRPSNFQSQSFSANTAETGPNEGGSPDTLVWVSSLPSSYESASGQGIEGTVRLELRDGFSQVITTESYGSVSLSASRVNTKISGSTFAGFTNGIVQFSSNESVSPYRFSVYSTPPGQNNVMIVARTSIEGVDLQSYELELETRYCVEGEREKVDQCELCPAGSYSDERQSTSCTAVPAGSFQSSSGSTSYSSCSPGTFSASPGASECVPCGEGTFSAEHGATSCTRCPANSEQTVNRTSCTCSPNTALKSSDENEIECVECPVGADCRSGAVSLETLTALPGNWRSSSGDFYSCPFPGACIGGEEVCLSPYFEGIACSECSRGYGREGKFECSSCPEGGANEMRIIAGFVGVMLIISIMTWNTLRTALKAAGMSSVAIKIFVSAIQFNSLAMSFDFHWIEPVKTVLTVQETAVSIGSSLLNIDCFFSESTSSDPDYDSPFYVKSLLFFMLPFLLAIGAFSILFPLYIVRKAGESSSATGNDTAWGKFKENYVASIVVSLFLVHPSITQQTFKMLTCRELGKDEEGGPRTYLDADLSEECWVSK